MEWVQPPSPPSIENVQKKAQNKLPQNFWIRLDPPPHLLENVQKDAAFFFVITSLTRIYIVFCVANIQRHIGLAKQ